MDFYGLIISDIRRQIGEYTKTQQKYSNIQTINTWSWITGVWFPIIIGSPIWLFGLLQNNMVYPNNPMEASRPAHITWSLNNAPNAVSNDAPIPAY